MVTSQTQAASLLLFSVLLLLQKTQPSSSEGTISRATNTDDMAQLHSHASVQLFNFLSTGAISYYCVLARVLCKRRTTWCKVAAGRRIERDKTTGCLSLNMSLLRRHSSFRLTSSVGGLFRPSDDRVYRRLTVISHT